eukprot:15367214-Ditylum_brightwellii.AAC.6
MASQRHDISPEHLHKAICELSSDVAPGLGGIRNEHITSIHFSDQPDVTELAKYAVDHVCELTNAIHTGDLPDYFYAVYVATRLVAANKKEPAALDDDEEMPVHPINYSTQEMYKDYNGCGKKHYATVDKKLCEHKVDAVKDCSDNKKTRLTIITRESVYSQEISEILTPGSGGKKVNYIVAKGMAVVDALYGLDLKRQSSWEYASEQEAKNTSRCR